MVWRLHRRLLLPILFFFLACSDDGNLVAEGIPCRSTGDCAVDQHCSYPVGSCGIGGPVGTCVTIPEACIELYDPVCGCDDKTYGNSCFADMAGISVKHTGECEKVR